MSRAALVVLNRSAGVGHLTADGEQLAGALKSSASLPVELAAVDGHPAARSAAARFAADSEKRSLIVAAGGGGTLRAVVEGVMDAFPNQTPTVEQLRIGALRMGSGNVIARSLRVPLNPIDAARQIGEGFARGDVAFCSVLRCTHGEAGGGSVVRHAITMAGFGAWGRVPGDIASWRGSHARGRKRAASWIGLERVNTFEYLAFGTGRMLAGAMSGRRCELIEMDGARRFRLLAAVALNLPLPPLPDPGVKLGDEAAGLAVVPRFGRPFRSRLEPGHGFRIRLLDRESVQFFLDEDPETAYGWLHLEVAGLLPFVPGQAA